MFSGLFRLIRYSGLFMLFITVLAFPGRTLLAGSEATPEYKLKAALLYKLTRFIEWPQSDNKRFSICVLGEDVFGKALDSLRTRKVKGLPIEVTNYRYSDAITKSCQILFITESKQIFLKNILNRFHNKATLTISDIEDFAEQGGMIEFTRGMKKIGFTINLKQAKQGQLSIAAPLLQLATVIDAPQGAK